MIKEILNELKNQADDIKIFYQELNNINANMKQINKNKTNKRDLNLNLDYSIKPRSIQEIRSSFKENSNIMSLMDTEL